MSGLNDYALRRKRVRVVVEKDEAGRPKRAIVGDEQKLRRDGVDMKKIKDEGGEVLDEIDN